MKTQIRMFTILAAACGFANAAAHAADIDRVIVRQQWPWSTDIEIEYMLSGVTSPVNIHVQAYNGSQELPAEQLADAISGDRYGVAHDGIGLLTIDPVKAFGTDSVVLPNFKVRLTLSDSAANVNEVIYKIFDLATGDCTDVSRADILNGKYGAYETDYGKIGEGYNTTLEDVLIWTGVTNNIEYKTTKLVMRKIPANGVETKIGGFEWQTLGKANAAVRTVSFTNDYYMSVFEFTEGQFLTLVTNTPNSTITYSRNKFTNGVERYIRPMNIPDYVSRARLSYWPTEESYGKGPFPDNRGTVIGNLRAQTGLVGFDLPTEAVWEYACRAGTTNDFYTGLNFTNNDDYKLIARCNSNSGNPTPQNFDKPEITDLLPSEGGSAIVGSYRPNAWGLYDMLGNLAEYCLDHYQADVSAYGGPDPWGPVPSGGSSLYRVFRGSSYYLNYSYGNCSYRQNLSANSGSNPIIGLRLCLTVF
ncbi:MAG: SUMF1/EgtB/PvdO family nonheme iron enzyme [Kiritimatiellae bacterium]|nr:SUMF1/EgtB/PvdO family nonheme iron enzyme [Kiritimatiellia bacterium]